MIIESPENSIFKKLMSLTKSKGVLKQGQALVSGEKITGEISKLSHLNPFWVVTPDMNLPQAACGQTVHLSKELFCRLDVCGTHKPLLCCEYEKPKSLSDLNPKLATIYVGISDPGNLGALVRSCVAFRWPQIVLLSEAAHPFLPKAVRGSSGAVFKTSFFSGPSILDISDPGIMALDRKGQALNKKNLKKNLKLLVGEEGLGVPENFKGQRLSISISNDVESLNATVAASLVVYEWSRLFS